MSQRRQQKPGVILGCCGGGARHKAEEVGGCGQLSRRVWPYNLSLDPVAL